MVNVFIYFPDCSLYNKTPPFEIYLQKAFLMGEGVGVTTVDGRIENIEVVVANQGKPGDILVVSTISLYTSITSINQMNEGIRKAALLREKFGLLVIWTGIAPKLFSEILLSSSCADYLVASADESKLLELIRALNSKTLPTSSDRVVTDNSAEGSCKNNNLFYYGNFDMSKENLKPYIHQGTIDYISSAGCKNKCAFCMMPFVYQRQWYPNSVENVLNHLRNIVATYPEIKSIHFRDDNFFVDKGHALNIAREIKRSNLPIWWSAQGSVNFLNTLSDDDFRLLKNSGCSNISYGVESGDDINVGINTYSKTNTEKSIKMLKHLLKFKISPSVTSIVGFPHKSGSDFGKTLKLLMRIKCHHPPTSVYCTVYQPLPKSLVYEAFYSKSTIEAMPVKNAYIDRRKLNILQAYEDFYFLFIDPFFFNKAHSSVKYQLMVLNVFFFPFIWLRFKVPSYSFLWEYAIARPFINALKKNNKLHKTADFSSLGVRHQTINQSYGLNKQTS